MGSFRVAMLLLTLFVVLTTSSCEGDWIPIRNPKRSLDDEYVPYSEPYYGHPEIQTGFTPIEHHDHHYDHHGHGHHFDHNLFAPAIPYHSSRHTVSTVDNHVPYSVPHPIPVHIARPYPVPVHVSVPVDVPRGVKVPVPHPVPFHFTRTVPVPVPRPVPFPVPHGIPVQVTQPVGVPVPQPVGVPVPQPVPVHQPYGLPLPFAFRRYSFEVPSSALNAASFSDIAQNAVALQDQTV